MHVSRSVYNFMRSVRKLVAGLVDKKSACTGSSGECCGCSKQLQMPSLLTHFAAGRVVELAIVEPQISLQEQSSLTPASGVYR